MLVKVGLPRSMPYFFGSLKVAITLAFVGTTVSEMTASNEGIGYLLVSAGSAMQMGLAFAGLRLDAFEFSKVTDVEDVFGLKQFLAHRGNQIGAPGNDTQCLRGRGARVHTGMLGQQGHCLIQSARPQ